MLTNQQISDLVSTIYSLKEKYLGDDFFSKLYHLDEFSELVSAVKRNQSEFELTMKKKLEKIHKVDEKLSPAELEWKKYFLDHEFKSIEEQRNLADALSILTGLPLTKFMKIGKESSTSFPKGICIVPLRNSNMHTYKIGVPIYSIQRGNMFTTSNGKYGNSIMNREGEYRMGTDDEIKTILAWIFYKNGSLVEPIIYDLVSGEDGEEEEHHE